MAKDPVVVKEPFIERPDPRELHTEMSQSYLTYALSVNLSRAIPSVFDGFKPVHRRVLYTMYELGARAGAAYKKSARIEGQTTGTLHPHGGCYGAMVTLAAVHKIRTPLIDGQGNYGSIDDDPPAAPRYTEARLTKLATEMFDDIDADTVDWQDNYDNTLLEPKVLPLRFPNLLINGSQGIGVGMVTSVPPHNLTEVMNACIAMVDDPKLPFERLTEIIPAPDFPLGGLVYGWEDIRKGYATGRGRCMIRSKYKIESIKGDKRQQIVFTDIPYQVIKSAQIEKIANLVHEKVITGISDIRDESDKDDLVRIVIELKKNESPELIVNQIYKHTELQTSFPFNMLVVINGNTRVLSLREILDEFIGFRKEVVHRRSTFHHAKNAAKIHVLTGIETALASIQDVITVIRGSKSTVQAEEGLKNLLKIDDIQVKAILEIRLARLTTMEVSKVTDEIINLKTENDFLFKVMNDTPTLVSVVRKEFEEIIEKYGEPRRSELADDFKRISREDTIPDEEIIVSISRDGYIKRSPVDLYKKQKRGGRGKVGAGTKDEDIIEQLMMVKSHDTIVAVSNMGKAYALKGYEIPEASLGAKGKHLANLIGFGEGERIESFVPIREFGENEFLFFFTKNGTVKKTKLSEYANIRRNGLIAIDLEESDELVSVRKGALGQHVVIATDLSMIIRFPEDEVRATGRSARGVRGIKLIPKDFVVDAEIVDPLPEVEESQEAMIGDDMDKEHGCFVTVSDKGMGIRCSIPSYRIQGRGGLGSRGMQVSSKSGNIAGFLLVRPEDNLITMTESGMTIRFDPWEIRKTGRRTKGVKVLTLKGNDKIIGVVKVSREEPDEDVVPNEQPNGAADGPRPE